MPDDARLWIYVADRELSAAEIEVVTAHLSSFIASWTAHGTSLKAGWSLYFHRVLILAVDPRPCAASGCSIDSSTAALQKLGASLGLDWFTRTTVLHRDPAALAFTASPLNMFWAMRKAGTVNDRTEVVNTLVGTRGEWLSLGIQSFRKSWHQSMW